MRASNFILFAHARSGSTSLAKATNLHPELAVAVEPFLDPRAPKINGEDTYRSLSNASEINKHFGNDATGWLFKR